MIYSSFMVLCLGSDLLESYCEYNAVYLFVSHFLDLAEDPYQFSDRVHPPGHVALYISIHKIILKVWNSIHHVVLYMANATIC